MALPPGFGRDGSEEIDAVTGHLEFLGGLRYRTSKRLDSPSLRSGVAGNGGICLLPSNGATRGLTIQAAILWQAC